MKKTALVLTALCLLAIMAASAEDWTQRNYEYSSPGIDTSDTWTIEPYDNYINFALQLYGSPPDSIACDTLKIYIDTKFSNQGSAWTNLLNLATLKKDSTVYKYIPMDSLKLGTYKIGPVMRMRIARSDTITADTTYKSNPWKCRLSVGYH